MYLRSLVPRTLSAGKQGRDVVHRDVQQGSHDLLGQIEVRPQLKNFFWRRGQAWIENGRTERKSCLRQSPGIGQLFSSVIATEIDGIKRFNPSAKLAAYAGVLPMTHASGGRVFNGRLLWQCNKWLRWALIEASWSAIQFSGYFGTIYRNARAW